MRLHSSTKCSGRAKNHHLLEVARSLMLSTSLPSYLWGDAILATAHLINRISFRILHLQTPLECLKESYPSTRLVSKVPLRVFGCTAYVHNFDPNHTKFTHRAQACVFVGRNPRNNVRSPTSQPPAPVQDFEPPRDQEEKDHGDEIEVKTETNNNEADQDHTGKINKYDPSLNLPITLRKANGTLDRHKARLVAGFTQTYGVDHS
ncbi:Retrovirus-related Pol polyprotein from transposon TNT 1-94 [Cucumis melo var. makuwa]|uniref:Retrovirus-related Pol polyprotein from transposon TNT 1-94 n=1 Tax=Cucumis melo var. makuwa TaxID=1194695 RepID=A0A5A7SUG8_CUCMM|nr:Retrovirus-related Pol polyprotein from transposon TNT 1-94 [Cucumis melo var. makuwa]TYK30572.1 Retrovirus-related Pol polyprotein from transposon TNT 1-94 [Cucumis melo var. makuwa]